MSWTTVVWTMTASAYLTFGAFHVLLALRQRSRVNLLFSVTALSGAVMAGCELALMRATTLAQYGAILRWMHVPIFILVVSLVLFVRAYFGTGRRWLAGIVIGLRGSLLLVNFLRSPNLNFVEVAGPRRVRFLGQEFSAVEGIVSSWTRLGELTSILLILFLCDATISVWRRGDRRRGIVGIALIAFVVLAAGITSLTHADVLRWPYMLSLWYLGVLGVMTYDLTYDVLRAKELSSALRKTETDLVEREGQLAIASAVPELAFWTWDVERDEVWMTDNGRLLRGYAPEEKLTFGRLLSGVHPEDREGFERSVRESFETQGSFQMEYRALAPGGQVHWLNALGRVGTNGAGGSPRVRGVSIDVTALKLSELEVGRQRRELTHLARVATLGQLSGSLAHELNQPLTAILSNAQAAQRFLASNGGAPDEVREILEDIVREDKHAGEVIRRLRSFLKKEEGEENREILDVGEVIEEALRLVRTELLDRGMAIDKQLASNLAPVRADRVQIQQVLVNLVTNACDAMADTESSEQRLFLRAEPSGGMSVRVSLSDRGRGIPEEDLERIFEPFISRKAEGMGLGLAVCRTIIAAHGGRLWATNNPDRGSTFHFTIPGSGANP